MLYALVVVLKGGSRGLIMRCQAMGWKEVLQRVVISDTSHVPFYYTVINYPATLSSCETCGLHRACNPATDMLCCILPDCFCSSVPGFVKPFGPGSLGTRTL
jgi:hypothetical protein